MRQSSIKIIIFLQLALYLIGGHAAAHGLAWCISAEGHAHVATAAGCVTGEDDLSCTTAGSCLTPSEETATESCSDAECRHLPVTSPHSTGVASAHKVETGSVVAILPAVSAPTLRGFAAAIYQQSPFPVFVDLPRPVALVSLRTIVLVI